MSCSCFPSLLHVYPIKRSNLEPIPLVSQNQEKSSHEQPGTEEKLHNKRIKYLFTMCQ
jgi:hypothetical protein